MSLFRTARLTCILLFAVLPTRAVALEGGLELREILELRTVGAAELSPDGQRIAYTLVVPRKLPAEKDGGAWTELHVHGPGSASRAFVAGQVNVDAIDWLPDGSAVSFLAKREGDETRRLYAIPIDGGEARVIAELETDISSYSFAPDGKRVALLAFEPEPKELKKEREMGFSQRIFEEDWKPRRVYVAELGEDAPEARMLELEGSVQRAHWSPAGDRLALVVTPRELVDDTLMFQRIRIVAPDGRELGRIDNPGKLGALAWSPNGESLAFIATETVHDTNEGRLMVAGKEGGAWRHLLPGLEGHVMDVAWSDAERVLLLSHEGVDARVGSIRRDGTGASTLAPLGGPIFETLRAAGGRIALVAHTPAHPRELYALEGTAARRLTDSNPWLAERRLARQEPISYAARDGLVIQGLLVHPLERAEGERRPLILVVHGGPEAHYSNGWLSSYAAPAQHSAARGYYVFYPNYRGSTGRGVEFALRSQGRPAAEEFDDLVDGVDHLVAQGLVDRARVGVTGGSYGGYASAWCATYYSERFAAAVMNVGLSDKLSMVGTSDIPQELHLVHYRTWPWESRDLYLHASPIHHVQKAKTPILILHGDADPRVDPTQSRILYRYLKLQKDPAPVRLVLYPGEGHGNRRAASRLDYALRFVQWMDHYLLGPGGAPPDARIEYPLEVSGDG